MWLERYFQGDGKDGGAAISARPGSALKKRKRPGPACARNSHRPISPIAHLRDFEKKHAKKYSSPRSSFFVAKKRKTCYVEKCDTSKCARAREAAGFFY